MNFGIQIAWIVLNIGTISLLSIFLSKRYLSQSQQSEISHHAEKKHGADSV